MGRPGDVRATEFDPNAALREIATTPRLTGSEGAAEVGAKIRSRFEGMGYHVDEREFTFSPLLGRFGITAVGALYLVTAFTASMFLYTGHPFGALALLLILLVLLVLGALFSSAAIDSLPYGRQQGVNMFATRPGGTPRYIIMAHRDTKSQPLPLAFRGPAIILGILVWIALVIASLMHAARPLPGSVILLLGVTAVITGVILIFCWVDNRSPGALDNASGVVAALGIAAREHQAGDVAFLITDAEELGLAGARAAAGGLPPVFGVINLDGLDDAGAFYVLERFGIFRKKGLAPHLAAALLQEADARGEDADRRDLPFGIPVDHIPMVEAGIPALTLMRGTMQSLRRVHRPGDDLDHLRGDGVRKAIDLVSGALDRLREQSRHLER
ncbi:MAG TPA: M28 family peptidase [Longimicrobiales bacterium]|nr:M28 family peptidase [Longimicrobiales bacterium]